MKIYQVTFLLITSVLFEKETKRKTVLGLDENDKHLCYQLSRWKKHKILLNIQAKSRAKNFYYYIILMHNVSLMKELLCIK
jgi:hypothetical protein